MKVAKKFTTAHRYLDPKEWWAALSLSYLHVLSGCLLVWVTSNGIAATAQQCPLAWVREAFVDSGTPWRAAIVQALVHSTYKIVVYVNKNTPRKH